MIDIPRVGILDGQAVQSVAFSKKLQEHGCHVTLFCDSKYSYGFWTRYANKKIICPSNKTDLSEFDHFFKDYIKKNKLDLVIPMNDESAMYLSQNKIKFDNFFKLIIPDIEIFENGYDKNQLMRFCSENGFDHPRTINLEDTLQIIDFDEFTFPGIIKPNKSSGARGFKIVNSIEEISTSLPSIVKKHGKCHLQEFIPCGGKQYKVQVFIYEDELIASSVIEKLRYYPINGGSSCFNKTIRNDKLVQICFRLLSKMGWVGFADFDLIEDPRNEKILIIELNPRVPACIKSSFISDVDFAKAYVDITFNRISKKSNNYEPDKYLRYLAFDILWLIKRGVSVSNFRKFTKHFFSKKHFFQDLDLTDIMSFIAGSLGGLMKLKDSEYIKEKKF